MFTAWEVAFATIINELYTAQECARMDAPQAMADWFARGDELV